MANANKAREAAKSGKFKIMISADDTGNFVTIEFLEGESFGREIRLKPVGKIPFVCLMVATEHLMRLTAQESSAGFDKALQLLLEGAKANETVQHPHRMTY